MHRGVTSLMGDRSRRNTSWQAPVILIALTVTVSLLTIYNVHNRQRSFVADPYRAANTEEDDLEMQVALDAINEMNAHTSPPPSLPKEFCHVQENNEFDGRVVKWGADHFQDTSGACCSACHKHPDCNVWVWCGKEQGCGSGRQHKECWLKHNSIKNVVDSEAHAHPGIPWTSGSIYTDEERGKVVQAEKERLQKLKDDKELPLVYFDIGIKGEKIGRISMVLYKKESPRAAENFRALCTGEKGIVPSGHEGAGKPYHFKGATFYRIIDRFIDQSGANTESIYGGAFKDDPGGLALKHDRKGLLSMANAGQDTNTSHFSILMAPAPHLDTHYTIFGEVVEGFDVAEKINALARGKPNNTAGPEEQAVILDSGQIR